VKNSFLDGRITIVLEISDSATEFVIIRSNPAFKTGASRYFSKKSDFATEFAIIRSKTVFQTGASR
jgi:hypothetical protein